MNKKFLKWLDLKILDVTQDYENALDQETEGAQESDGSAFDADSQEVYETLAVLNTLEFVRYKFIKISKKKRKKRCKKK